MPNNILVMKAPSGFSGSVQCTTSTPPSSGQTYTPDANGLVNVDPVDVSVLQRLGFTLAYPYVGETPVAQRSGSAQAQVTTTAPTNSTPYGFSQAQCAAILAFMTEARATFIAMGPWKGSA
jgi:hypothetical protein